MMKQLSLFILTILISVFSKAQVKFKNSGATKLNIAICFYNNSSGWTTKGWYPLEPDEEKSIMISMPANPNFYYCATIQNCNIGYFGDTYLAIDPRNAFTLNNADKISIEANPQLKKYGFKKIDLGGLTEYTVELNPINLICNNKKQGKWRLGLDKEGDYAEKKEDQVFYREITFDEGKPIGWCKDYYNDGTLKAEFKLISYSPVVYDGKCTWYGKDGMVEKEAIYKNGVIFNEKSTNIYGQSVTKQTTLKVVEMPVQNFYINSTSNEEFKGGNSKTLFYVNLPQNTVEWYYEFTASRNADEVAANKAQFSAAAKLTTLIDKTGLVAGAINLLTAPPGGNKCDVFVLDGEYYQEFRDGGKYKYRAYASRQNFNSGIVQVKDMNITNPIIGIKNTDYMNGIHVAIQIVAIVSVLE